MKFKLRENPKGRGFGIKTFQITDVRAFGTTPQLAEINTGHPHHDTTYVHLNAIF